jgi:(E)-4-hydroxy-3-methylbut-2-enyl-diphosphate synthase
MNRFGDSPRGMVESALEYARIARQNDFHDLIFSMKSSNPVVMIHAYRLLVAEMNRLGWDYPLHLGVTEAGSDEEGRIKSSMGIGSLLLDGLGDTIRVSLTEDPWFEVDPCKRLISFAKKYESFKVPAFKEFHRDFQAIEKRKLSDTTNLPLHRDGSVFLQITEKDLLLPDFFPLMGCKLSLNGPIKTPSTIDAVVLKTYPKSLEAIEVLKKLQLIGVGVIAPEHAPILLRTLEETSVQTTPQAVIVGPPDRKELEKLLKVQPSIILFSLNNKPFQEARYFMDWLQENELSIPVILQMDFQSISKEDLVIQAGAQYGALLCDSRGEGICLSANQPLDFLHRTSFQILQAARMRSIQTEFISCPSCGRTLFNLQQVTKRIREKTAHLPGVKIAIMGCIVNGPGEMADADFGYVGSRPDMIDLYVGKKCVEKNIPFEQAEDRLIELIRAHGRWVEPEIEEAGIST